MGTDAATLRAQDAAFAREMAGLRWYRCLRCDAWTARRFQPVATREHPPARDEIEVPQRGKALRDRVVLRLIAVDRVIHFLLLAILGIAVLAFAVTSMPARQFYRVLSDLQGGRGGRPGPNTTSTDYLHEVPEAVSLQLGNARRGGA